MNRELRGVRVVLGYLAELDLLPKINEGDLRRALKKLPVTVERTEYLKPSELTELIGAALAHDAATYQATREELAGLRPLGSSARLVTIAPCLVVLLLTGMRLGEGLDLDWSQVDLDAKGDDGEAVGEIHLTGATKAKRARRGSVGLPCPAAPARSFPKAQRR